MSIRQVQKLDTLPLKTAKIGRCGELLVQYLLLLGGVDSALMSTDSGVDLVAYASKMPGPMTIQVKTNLRPKASGGKGKSALDWWISDQMPWSSQLVALVDLSTQRLWMFKSEEVPTLAQQHPKGRYHLHMYTDPTARPKKLNRLSHVYEFEKYLLSNRARELFGI
jgi:hypothetical protein